MILNILSIAAVILSTGELVAQQYFLINLSIGDILMALVSLPKLVALHLNYDSCGLFFVKNTLLATVHIASEMALLLLGLDLYIMLYHPLKHKILLNPVRARLLCVGGWLVGALIGCGHLVTTVITSLVEDKDICDVDLSTASLHKSALVGCFYVPVAVFSMLLLYGRIARGLSRKTGKDSFRGRSTRKTGPSTKVRKAFLTIMVILVTYLCCYLPTRCIYLYAILMKNKNYNLKYIYRGLSMLAFVNGICDPLVYSLRMRNVRAGYKVMFRRGFRESRRKSETEITLSTIAK